MVGEESFTIIGPRAIENVWLAVRRGVSYQLGNKTPSMAVHRCKEPPEVGRSCCRDAAEEPRMNDLWTQPTLCVSNHGEVDATRQASDSYEWQRWRPPRQERPNLFGIIVMIGMQ